MTQPECFFREDQKVGEEYGGDGTNNPSLSHLLFRSCPSSIGVRYLDSKSSQKTYPNKQTQNGDKQGGSRDVVPWWDPPSTTTPWISSFHVPTSTCTTSRVCGGGILLLPLLFYHSTTTHSSILVYAYICILLLLLAADDVAYGSN